MSRAKFELFVLTNEEMKPIERSKEDSEEYFQLNQKTLENREEFPVSLELFKALVY